MGAVKPMVRLPSTNSRIWSNVSRSMFCMVMFIHPKHGTFLRLSLRLISHWKHFAPPGSSRIGNEPPLQAHSALDNSTPCDGGGEAIDFKRKILKEPSRLCS